MAELNILNEAKRVLEVEAQAVSALKERIGDDFIKAVEVLKACEGKVIISGIGKSGIIARKIASTLSSTGTPSMYLHPAEGSHGDLGVVTPQDVLVVISYGGESTELEDLLKYAKRRGIKVVAMTGNKSSRLGQSGDVVLDISVSQEACPLGLAPTTSTTVTLAMGDALAMSLLMSKGFKKEDFAVYHPGGKLGRRLLTRVEDVMRTEELPIVGEETSFKELLYLMTKAGVRGICGVVNSNTQDLVGVITDGDLRRRINQDLEAGLMQTTFSSLTAKDLMSANPKTLDQSELAEKALFLMEQFKIQCLFVNDRQAENTNKPIGLIHLQDLLAEKIR